jgi:deazaflavin-dependent oxidoreductase (nitroreductase family)
MFTSGKITYEVGGYLEATPYGGLAAMHRLVTKLGLVDAINERVHLAVAISRLTTGMSYNNYIPAVSGVLKARSGPGPWCMRYAMCFDQARGAVRPTASTSSETRPELARGWPQVRRCRTCVVCRACRPRVVPKRADCLSPVGWSDPWGPFTFDAIVGAISDTAGTAEGTDMSGHSADKDPTTRRPPPNDQLRAYLEGHRRNPLTTTFIGARILNAVQVPWFRLLPPRGFGVLTTVGRKTGKRRRKCVRAIRNGEKVYLVSLTGSGAAWFLNLKASPHVELRIRGGIFDGLAREITDPAELEDGKRIYSGTVNPFDGTEYRMHRSGAPTDEKIRAMHEKWYTDGTPVVIQLPPSSNS